MTYPSDLNDAEWPRIQPLSPPAKPIGKQREADLRAVLNAIFYRADNGIKWRALTIDFPNWQTVYGYYRAESGRGKLLPHIFFSGAGSMFGGRLTMHWSNKFVWTPGDKRNQLSASVILSQ